MKKLLKWILLSSIIIMLVGCRVVPPIPPEPNGVVYRAYFIGVGKYQNNWWLPSPVGNTEKLEDLFINCKFGEEETEFEIIEKLTNEQATKDNILNGILEVFADVDNNDVSYFYYMGHGGVKNGDPVITPYDYDSSMAWETAIRVHELEEYLSRIPGTKIVFLETCYAGNFIGKFKNKISNEDFTNMVIDIFAQKSKDLINKEGYQVLASSKGTEPTWDTCTGSYFCTYLIRGCENLNADSNEDKIVDLSELHKYILWHVSKQTVQIYPDGSTFPIVEY